MSNMLLLTLNQLLLLCAVNVIGCLGSRINTDDGDCDDDYQDKRHLGSLQRSFRYNTRQRSRVADGRFTGVGYMAKSAKKLPSSIENRLKPNITKTLTPKPKATRQRGQCGYSFVRSLHNRTRHHGNHRVAGGYDAKKGQFPSYMYLKSTIPGMGKTFCGATIIDGYHILTAAHCVGNENSMFAKSLMYPSEISAKEGWNKVAKICKSKKYYKHEDEFGRYDLAILKMQDEILFSETVQSACLPDEKIEEGTQAYAVGMGFVSGNPKRLPEVLQVLPVIRSNCTYDQHESVICFKSNSKFKGDTCGGDSGGPVYAMANDAWYVYGATSYGPDTCEAGSEGTGHYADLYELRYEIETLREQCADEIPEDTEEAVDPQEPEEPEEPEKPEEPEEPLEQDE